MKKPRSQSMDAGWYPPMRFWAEINSDRPRFVHYLRQGWNDDLTLSALSIKVTFPDSGIRVFLDNPDVVSDEAFASFVKAVVQVVRFHPDDGEWDIRLNQRYQRIFDSSLECERQDIMIDAYEDKEAGT